MSAGNEASVDVASGPLVGPVLGRVVGMLAARADCPIDRLDDALLLADAIAAGAGPVSADDRVRVRIAAGAGAVELRVGPLRAGGADALVASSELPGVGNVLERVSDGLERQDGDGREYLLVRLRFGAPAASEADGR